MTAATTLPVPSSADRHALDIRELLGYAFREPEYPETDGLPMANNTEHFRWIGDIQSALDDHFLSRPDVFVAADLLWYPVYRHPEIAVAPDVFVAFGRPKGRRPSYKQWEEGNIPPQVVFEFLSPSNTEREMALKELFFLEYGVEEYYLYDMDEKLLHIHVRQGASFRRIPPADADGFASPRLGLTFHIDPENGLRILRPDQAPLEGNLEVRAKLRAEQDRAQRLAARLRELGVEDVG